ncbi:C40 family peptidase [Streptosporangium sp. NBC_01810]|uniref:C40 family peptidase n=1 Tax=Streptosporangium sp. NBC_01810 TaxID=2975951 RepID=UPI002DD90CC8|nr:NlpC/P60 family protein [Streptosporangium sp. NBC_01810]WSA26120.1 C40 family peptidase [Streptosporangium sp. NBC_01810]
MFDRRPRVSDLIREARKDLAYRPRLRHSRRTARLMRQAVPILAVLLVGVLATGLMIVTQLPEADPERVTMRRSVATVPTQMAKPTQMAQAPAPVAPLTSMRKPNLFVVAPRPLSSAVVAKIAQLSGVRAVERADAAEVTLDGKRVQTLGVNPSTFRAYTPKPTARSDRLWRNVSAGEVAVSFVLGNDGGMPLGKTFTTAGRNLRVGAYATMGMGAIDAVVSRPTARALGIPENNALVVSAPKADSAKLRRTLLGVLPKGGQVAVINPVLTVPRSTNWPDASFMTTPQVRTALTAAIGKLGRPYVWGAEGPDSFDCSGLVQWAYAQAGIKVPRVTHQQFVSGPQIPLAQAQPGDLLFWRHDPTNPGYVSHVAIYWGDGKMLHAPRTGDVVKLVPVTTRNFAGAVRISPGVAARVR